MSVTLIAPGEANSTGYLYRSLLVLMALFHLCQGDSDQCIVEGASFGRDCDTAPRILQGTHICTKKENHDDGRINARLAPQWRSCCTG